MLYLYVQYTYIYMHRYISAKKYIIKDNRYRETIPDQKCKWISPLSNFIAESAPIRGATNRKALVRATEYSITANNEQRSIPVTRCNQQFYVGHFELIWLVATWSVAWEKCRNTSGDAKTRHIHDPIVLLSCVLCTHGLPHLFHVDITDKLINKASIHMAECYITDDHVSNTWPFKRAL